ncbi:hypothetical protein EN836_10325 [Mesorhizobium sp. M1C.F.Ca.ET.193.01.1.1]|uniref:hypothetical protein n=1 Tax=unclassified Mesorhizobium TaxID=325217 RepID=UPI000FD1D61C|nr:MULTISPECIES: hypothetical protein [unclassified Mesorhizobium]TGT02175.1 hypothetical protein EN820_26625 [bacterium M00.F.Ca.ET.177.01.1.1]RWA59513.1 MAG: hypothetical protein EOQ28_33060 [Mesorhizobium sp.]RWB93356.1 MAG: hypothetical protein EOQ57_34360 [Mesorhizobium sp.]RWG77527.1 MAG: hypothetical protein EOQ70_32195 [Mesorhizobium sp.]RWG79804.1 MAG: hypothetical protein EOQ69_23315 [Mesorhizobium sp.]
MADLHSGVSQESDQQKWKPVLRPIAPFEERRPACSAVAGGVVAHHLPKAIVTRVRGEGKENRNANCLAGF